MAERRGGNGNGSGGHEGPLIWSLPDWAAKLHGKIDRDDRGRPVIRAPGPGHSKDDLSLTVWPDEEDPQGFRVHSFASDDFAALRDYVRDACGAPDWKPAAKANGAHRSRGEIAGHYVYEDLEGRPVQRVTRYVPKGFSQSYPVGSGWEPGGIQPGARVPYRLPEIVAAGAQGQTIYVVEGEKSVQRLWEAGLAATCSSGGAGKWGSHFAKWFDGFEVVVLPDNDAPGRKHAEAVRMNLEPVAASIRVINLPGLGPGEDVVDWLARGGDPDTIADLPTGPPRRGLTAEALWYMEFPPIKFAVPGYVAEGLTLLAGAPKRGKSWLALDACLAVSEAGFTLEVQCAQGDALYCALEDGRRRIKDRLHRVFALDRPPRRLTVFFAEDLPRLDAGCEEVLREWIASVPDPRLIVIDTLNFIRPERARDEDPYSYDYRSTTPLHRLALEFGIAIVIVHHTRKSPTDDYLESVSGTNGLTGGCDTVAVLERNGDGTFVFKGRGRDIDEFDIAVRFDRDECRWRALGDAAETKLSETRAAILAVLRDQGWFMTAPQVAQIVGCSRNAAAQMLFKMARDGQVIKGKRGEYGLPTVIQGDREGDDDD